MELVRKQFPALERSVGGMVRAGAANYHRLSEVERLKESFFPTGTVETP